MIIKTISEKTPWGIVPVSFDASSLVDAIDTVSLSIQVEYGADPNASSMFFGSYVISGPVVAQYIQGGLDNTIYLIRLDFARGNFRESVGLYLPVRDLS